MGKSEIDAIKKIGVDLAVRVMTRFCFGPLSTSISTYS